MSGIQIRLALGSLIALLLLVGGYFLVSRNSSIPPQTSEGSATTSVPISGGTVTVPVTGAVVGASSGANVSAPNWHTPLVSSPALSSDVNAALASQFSTIQQLLAKNPTDFNAWIDLGTIRKTAGDYAGAAEDWQYVSDIYPGNIVSFFNLGDLYANFIHDYPKAAAAYRQEITNDPTNVDAYISLFQLYVDQYPAGSSDPVGVIRQGIAANPKSIDLHVALARYYVSQKDIPDATVQYQAAISLAQSEGASTTVMALQSEMAGI